MTSPLARFCLTTAAGLNLFAALADPAAWRTIAAVALALLTGLAFARSENRS